MSDAAHRECPPLGGADIEYIRQMLTRLFDSARTDSLEEIIAMIESLPLTADGKRVRPGMTLWPSEMMPDEAGVTVVCHGGFHVRDNFTHNDHDLDCDEIAECAYATCEAAESAKGVA